MKLGANSVLFGGYEFDVDFRAGRFAELALLVEHFQRFGY